MTSSPTDPFLPDAPHDDGHDVRDLLQTHVPLSLLMDLVAPSGPCSQEILDAEGRPETAWWVTR